MSRHISAGFIVFRQSKQNAIEYLMLQHSTGRRHWTPPKGHLDEGESPLQAAERETKEEAGLDKNDYEHINNFETKITYDSNGRPKDVFYYLARIRNAQQDIKLSDEHQDSTWLNLKDACNLLTHEQTASALKQAEEFIKNSSKE